MKYCALVNTAHPAAGFISVGDVLTEKQVNALGAEKVAELVREKVLKPLPEDGPGNGSPRAFGPCSDRERDEDGGPEPETEAGEAEDESEEDEYEAGADEEMPELEPDIAEEIVNDRPAESKPPATKRGRRKNG